jgi:hypothetical protein
MEMVCLDDLSSVEVSMYGKPCSPSYCNYATIRHIHVLEGLPDMLRVQSSVDVHRIATVRFCPARVRQNNMTLWFCQGEALRTTAAAGVTAYHDT